MMGWMLIVALMLLCGAIVVVGGVGRAPGMTSSLVFGFLLVLTAFTRVLRGKA